eukprot:1308318-Pyramimonas_sp.AAC.2
MEQQAFIEYWFLLHADKTVKVIDHKGKWAWTRDDYNDRGDAATIEKRYKSIVSLGIFTDLRGGATLIEDRDKDNFDHYDVGHCASLADGARKLWEEDPLHKNLAELLKVGWRHCKVYKRETPPYARRWLKKKGNIVNDQVAQTGPLEVWREALQVQAMFVRRKKAMSWTVSAQGQIGLEDKRFEMACVAYPGRWPCKRSLEKCINFATDSKKVLLSPQSETTVWDELERRAMAESDLSSPA